MVYRRRKNNVFAWPGRRRRRSRNQFDVRNLRGGFGLDWGLSSETKKGIIIIVLFVLAALSSLGLFDLAGDFGQMIIRVLSWLLGALKWLFPVMALLFGYFMLRADKYQVKVVNYLGAIFLILGLTTLWHLPFNMEQAVFAANQGLGGGYVGLILFWPLLKFMGFWGALVVSLAIFLIGVLLTFETSLYGLMWPVKLFKFVYSRFAKMTERRKIKMDDDYEEEEDRAEIEEELESETKAGEDMKDYSEPQFVRKDVKAFDLDDEEMPKIAKPRKFGRKIELPLELLVSKSGKPTSGDIKSNQFIIKKTLSNFGIEVDMGDVNVGPTVTQYTFRPADGVKLSKITNLNSDLALALAVHPIRIEAPIPGRSLVGVEVPNQMAAKVTMNEILAGKKFKERENNLMLVLGKDVSGQPYLVQLDKMPHLLIAGATGSGKSVCINSIITSLLYQNSPDELKFTAVEMERRFEVLARAGQRNIAAYNKAADDKLPYIIFIIDELADLMSTAPNDIEAGIVRLAQMARAVGIYLVLATQRPSVEVITGLIKANIPARIAFSVASLIDSRTILDVSGAEKLVGRGDMLYIGPETSKPKRLQGVYISDRETHNIINYIKQQGTADYIEEVVERKAGPSQLSGGFYDDGGEALLSQTKDIIRESGKASASLLQRRLKIGYARAARILDLLEEQGLIGPADGAKPREVFLEKLGGISALEFSAREHNLTGELEPFNDNRPVPADLLDPDEEDNEDDENDDSTNFKDDTNEEENNNQNLVETSETKEESVIAEAENEPAETDSKNQKINPSAGGQKFFSEDEWT